MWLSGRPAGGAKGWWAAGLAFAEGGPKVWRAPMIRHSRVLPKCDARDHPGLKLLGSRTGRAKTSQASSTTYFCIEQPMLGR